MARQKVVTSLGHIEWRERELRFDLSVFGVLVGYVEDILSFLFRVLLIMAFSLNG